MQAALALLRRVLAACSAKIHAKRQSSLLAAVTAALLGSHLSISDLGRGLLGKTSVKHNIKRVDRLLGNRNLQAEAPAVYAAITQQCLAGGKTPTIIVDLSDLTADGRWQLLRASVAVEGRAVTLYEEVHPKSCATSVRAHRNFLAQLAEMLPDNCKPIIVTDAGFRSPWFKLVNEWGWYWIGRIRNRDMVRPTSSGAWSGCKTLYREATQTAKTLGQYEYVRSNPVLCQLVLVKRHRKGRHKCTLSGKRARSHHSLKHARTAREPWLLAVCPTLVHLSAENVVAIYAQRMQIEESFRDTKNERIGLGLSVSRSNDEGRLSILVLIGSLAQFALHLIGVVARAKQLDRQFHGSSRRSRPIFSVINLALQVLRKGLANLFLDELLAALHHLRCHHVLKI